MADDNDAVAEFSLEYSFFESGSEKPVSGKAAAKLSKEELSILPETGEPLMFTYRELVEISPKDYKLHIPTSSGEKLELYGLGYKYEDFIRYLNKLRNELIEKDMLIGESIVKSGIKAEVERYVLNELRGGNLECEIKLLETSLVFTPEKAEITRIPYSGILEFSAEDYKITVTCESGKKFIFSSLGNKYDSVKKELADAINELSLKAQSLLKELAPDIDSQSIRKAARLMKDGKSVSKKNIDSISPSLWEKLERKVKSLNFWNEYDFLKNLSSRDKLCIGLKRGLMGALTGDYVWFLFPVCGDLSKKSGNAVGNAVAMEAISEEEGGKATYFFRICPRKDYANMKDAELMAQEADKLLKTINSCMITINFRREPIYLTEEKLQDPKYMRYNFSIARLPELKILRELFIGRIIHSSFDQWKKDVSDLLKFNVDSKNDSERWTKNG